MPMKGSGRTELHEIDRFDGGVGWLAYPDEPMQRASHALVGDDGGVWVVDPVDADGLDDLLADLGDVAGTVVGLDRHTRDAAAIARRHDVPVYVPRAMAGVADDVDAETVVFDGVLGDSGYRTFTVVANALWKEVAFYHEADGTLLVPEAVGTNDYYTTRDERLGVHPMLRLTPPKSSFAGVHPDRVLVGHGEGIMADADTALSEAFRTSRKNSFGLYAKALRSFVS